MAGRIVAEDIAAVKERTSIVDVVRDHVTLRNAGTGSMKGLCPFHDEKSPSFTVRESAGTFHCFGCGEGGDVVAFVQKVDGLTFVEAVERLAARLGMEVRREEGGPSGESLGRRSRLVEAHRIAQELYADRLVNSPDARAARDFLRARDFTGADAARFGVGFSPRGGEELARLLRSRGFSEEEMALAGLVGRGARGSYDRFRGRLMWPIRDTSGDTIGFGARRIFDDDRIEAKYLNTTETTIYKKSQVLYGIDLAKKAISGGRRAVVVEGYTDVMAAHLSGVEAAVATCGTAFGVDHIKLLRRLMRDEPGLDPARIIFTFDGDAAGQKAAMKAFAEDQRWTAQSFVAVATDGMDPCDLRLRRGPEAVKHLVEDAVPMFEFAVRTLIGRLDLTTAEGRVQAMKVAAPVINSIKDPSLRPEYERTVAGWIGVGVEQLADAVRRAGTLRPPEEPRRREAEAAEPTADELAAALPMPNMRDPLVNAEAQLLQVFLQYPNVITGEMLDSIAPESWVAPAHRAVFDAVRSVVVTEGMTLAQWVQAVTTNAPLAAQPLVSALAVASLPVTLDPSSGLPEARYVASLVARVREVSITREIADSLSLIRRLSSDPDADPAQVRAVSKRLQDRQRALADLRERVS
ncbi:MAG TPA: DNA primase [Tetrasphaera sp.]|uniref:DNA primase n=1 Tax=Nostocoides sp. TaxID=1917966 RepID=UPI002CE45CFF|nr:DNA primase [Tetrasphaera sp.]HNQ07844.1 DNA primase [Tetrasphaera sp.]